MLDPVAVVDAYFAGVTAGDLAAVTSLFADDAELHNSNGTLSGAEAIAGMYAVGLKPGAMKPNPGPYVVDGDRVAAEINLDANGKPVVLGDFFTIRNGKIQRLAIYSMMPTDARFFDDQQGGES